MKDFRVFKQENSFDCGLCCLQMVSAHYEKKIPTEYLRRLIGNSKKGASLYAIVGAAKKIGFEALAIKITFEQLDDYVRLPCIIHYGQKHFAVIPPQNYSRNNINKPIIVADPLIGLIKISKEKFLKLWIDPRDNLGIALVIEPVNGY